MIDAGISGDRSFGRKHRLKGRSDFLETVKGEGSRKLQGKFCRISWIGSSDGVTRFGISISRKAGGALKRNRIKRKIRENLRNNKELWPGARMVVINIFTPVENEKELLEEINGMLPKINE